MELQGLQTKAEGRHAACSLKQAAAVQAGLEQRHAEKRSSKSSSWFSIRTWNAGQQTKPHLPGGCAALAAAAARHQGMARHGMAARSRTCTS